MVDGALRETEAVMGARKDLELVFSVGLVERLLQLAGNMRGDGLIGLGEGVVELTLDLVEEEMR